MSEFTIRGVLDLVPRGQIRIPAFQRGFVWDPDQVAYLMDSIYKGYPFGSLLIWRTREQLRSERQLGPFALPERDPDFALLALLGALAVFIWAAVVQDASLVPLGVTLIVVFLGLSVVFGVLNAIEERDRAKEFSKFRARAMAAFRKNASQAADESSNRDI